MPKTLRLTLPQTPFKTQEVVEGFWKGRSGDPWLLCRQQTKPSTPALPCPLICYLRHSFAHVFDVLRQVFTLPFTFNVRSLNLTLECFNFSF